MVSILHVVPPGGASGGPNGAGDYDASTEEHGSGMAFMRRLLRAVCGEQDIAHTHAVIGEPSEEIVRFALDAKPDLIVMATRSHRGFNRRYTTATTQSVARQACCPVLSVPETLLGRRGKTGSGNALTHCARIVAPTDFSANSAAALRFAGALAQAQGAELYVLNFSGEEPPRRGLGWLRGGAERAYNSGERLRTWARSHLNSADNACAVVYAAAPSVYMLLRQVELLKADLLVLGPRGYAWAERFRLSSATDGILRNASCPVLSLRAETLNAGL